ncbi:hypothetical protein Tco_0614936 [Tanacetum coccineum]
MQIVKDRLSYSAGKLEKGELDICKLINLMKDMVYLLNSTNVFKEAKAEGEKVSFEEDMALELAEEAKAKAAEEAKANIQGEPQPINTISSKEDNAEAQEKLLSTTSSEYSPTPPRDDNKEKGIAIDEEPAKHLMPLIKQGKKLKNTSPTKIQAQAQRLAEYEAKRKRMLEEYNHYITFRADLLPITKIGYKINNVSKFETMRIDRNNQPLSLIVQDKFVLKQLGLSEWIEIHALASRVKSKSNDLLLKNLKAKFEWIKTQAGKLGIPSPPDLYAFGLSAADKK